MVIPKDLNGNFILERKLLSIENWLTPSKHSSYSGDHSSIALFWLHRLCNDLKTWKAKKENIDRKESKPRKALNRSRLACLVQARIITKYSWWGAIPSVEIRYPKHLTSFIAHWHFYFLKRSLHFFNLPRTWCRTLRWSSECPLVMTMMSSS